MLVAGDSLKLVAIVVVASRSYAMHETKLCAFALAGAIYLCLPVAAAQSVTPPSSSGGAQGSSQAGTTAFQFAALLSSETDAASMAPTTSDATIRPFKFHASDESIADLRRRIA